MECHERLGELELVPGLVEARLEAGERAGLSLRPVRGCASFVGRTRVARPSGKEKAEQRLSGVLKDLAEFGGGELDWVGLHAAGGGSSLA